MSGHTHGHSHVHVSAASRYTPQLAVTLVLSLGVLAAQLVGGLLSGSLALLADAGHSVADVAGVAAALAATVWARRPSPPQRTFGRHRVEPLAAAANAVLLLLVAGWVLVEAAGRWGAPGDVAGGPMVLVALVSLAANGVGVVLLRRGAQESLTVRGAYLEVLADAFGSLLVLAAGVTIAWTGWVQADVVASVAIAAFIVPRAVRLLAETWAVFAEAAPRGVDLDRLRRHLEQVDGVVSVHDLHVWTITSGMTSVSAHVVVVDEMAAGEAVHAVVLERLQRCLEDCFAVTHCTFQLEPPGFSESATHP